MPTRLDEAEVLACAAEAGRLTDMLAQRAPRDVIVTELGRSALHFAAPKMTEDQREVWMRDYCEALACFAPGVVRKAFRTHLEGGQFFPKIADLVKLCRDIVERGEARIARLKALSSPKFRERWEEEYERHRAEQRSGGTTGGLKPVGKIDTKGEAA